MRDHGQHPHAFQDPTERFKEALKGQREVADNIIKAALAIEELSYASSYEPNEVWEQLAFIRVSIPDLSAAMHAVESAFIDLKLERSKGSRQAR